MRTPGTDRIMTQVEILQTEQVFEHLLLQRLQSIPRQDECRHVDESAKIGRMNHFDVVVGKIDARQAFADSAQRFHRNTRKVVAREKQLHQIVRAKHAKFERRENVVG